MNKVENMKQRHSLIKTLISSQEISNHTQLQKALKKVGVEVTQATLSRDLTELGIVRMPTATGSVYKINVSGDEYAFKFHVAEEIIAIDSNENMILIKTFPGRAQGVALLIDRQNKGEILGTIAGDDTIAVIPKSIKQIKKALETIKLILGVQ